MLLYYCWKCRKHAENKDAKVATTKNGRMMLL